MKDVKDNKMDPYSIFKHNDELSKNTYKLNEPRANDDSDYNVAGGERLFANGIGINPNTTLNTIRSEYMQNLQRLQENKKEIFSSTPEQ